MAIHPINRLVTVAAAPLILGGLLAGCGSPSSSPGSTGTSTASTPSSSPSPTSSAATSTAAPTPVTGFQVASVTFVSAQDGWVLGTASCASGSCLAIARTQDGGSAWTSVSAPPTTFETGGASTGVSGIRFANQQDGWVYGGQLWATHDGGTTWTEVTLPGLSSTGENPAIQALETSAGQVQAVYFGSSGFRIATSSVAGNSWSVSATGVAFGAGPVPAAQLLVQGAAGWAVENDRVVTGGARLQAGAWAAWTPPCSTVEGPATLAASSSQNLIAVCDDGLWGGGSPTERAYASTDQGATFSQLAAPLPSACQGAALASPSSSVAATGCGAGIEATFNGGSTWTSVYSGSGAITYLGFTTSSQGVAVDAASGSNLGSLLMTTDGGHTWTPLTI